MAVTSPYTDRELIHMLFDIVAELAGRVHPDTDVEIAETLTDESRLSETGLPFGNFRPLFLARDGGS